MTPLRGFDLLNDQVCVTNHPGMLCENWIGGPEGSKQIGELCRRWGLRVWDKCLRGQVFLWLLYLLRPPAYEADAAAFLHPHPWQGAPFLRPLGLSDEKVSSLYLSHWK